MKNLTKKTLSPELIVFVAGAVVMVFELSASRILAPYLGSSIVVWTSIIGVILGSLSIGYAIGGRISDKKPNYEGLFFVLLASSLSIFIMAIIGKMILENISPLITDLRLRSVVLTILLFSLPSIFLGMVTPYVVRLKIKSIQTAGATAGNLYSIATAGSIFGTFFGGFYLIPTFGSNKILLILAITMLLLSIIPASKKLRLVCIVVLSLLFISQILFPNTNPKIIFEKDTLYNRLAVYDFPEYQNGEKKMIRCVSTNGNTDPACSSRMFIGSDNLASEYAKYYTLFDLINKKPEKVLMIGGGALSFPKYFLRAYPPTSNIDVVEIDPEFEVVAKKYFKYKPNTRLSIFNEDGRMFLKRSQTKYDAILLDAFTKQSIPFHLTTKEALSEMYQDLSENGVLISNVISSVEGKRNKVLISELTTYKSVFPQVYVLPVYPSRPYSVQNVMLFALKTKVNPFKSEGLSQRMQYLVRNLWAKDIPNNLPVLTDDYAPIENYANTF